MAKKQDNLSAKAQLTLREVVADPARMVELFGGPEKYKKTFYSYPDTPAGKALAKAGMPNVVPPPDCLSVKQLRDFMREVDAKIMSLNKERLELTRALFMEFAEFQRKERAQKK
jgi:hypothetical protein